MAPSSKAAKPTRQQPEEANQPNFYFRLLKSHPVLVNTTQSILIAWLASITTNLVLTNQGLPSVEDYVIQAVVQGLYITPSVGAFMGWIQQQKVSAVFKVALDQFVFSPFFTFGIVLAFKLLYTLYADLGADVSSNWEAIILEVFRGTVKTQAVAWLFWLPQRTISTLFVPDLLALPFNTLCSFFWVCIFNYVQRP